MLGLWYLPIQLLLQLLRVILLGFHLFNIFSMSCKRFSSISLNTSQTSLGEGQIPAPLLWAFRESSPWNQWDLFRIKRLFRKLLLPRQLYLFFNTWEFILAFICWLVYRYFAFTLHFTEWLWLDYLPLVQGLALLLQSTSVSVVLLLSLRDQLLFPGEEQVNTMKTFWGSYPVLHSFTLKQAWRNATLISKLR